MTADSLAGGPPVDALLVVSFGGPEGPDDVMPFLERVTAGRNVPRPRLLQVAEQYRAFGGVSPINARTRELVDAVRALLAERGPDLPVYWGNRNWHPLLADTVRQMARDGVQHALAFVTSAYSGYSSCDQYVEDIARARAEVGDQAPIIDKLPVFFDRPGFVGPLVTHARAALEQLPADRREAARLVCTAHSVPLAMPGADEYLAQLRQVAAAVARGLGRDGAVDLVFQSRSGPPTQPWLEPDVSDHLGELAGRGTRDVVVVPIGFVSDHMEVVYDLDTKAAQTAASLGMTMVRASTPGTAPEFVAMVRELVVERLGAPQVEPGRENGRMPDAAVLRDPEQQPPRRVVLSGPLNFRDIGGYATADGGQVRWRQVFRSDSLARVSEDDARHLVHDLGLVSIVDLRTAEEISQYGRGPLEQAAVHYHHVPIIDETVRRDPSYFPERSLHDMYLLMLRTYGSQVAAVLRVLATEDVHPVVFHCAAGKDRTGIVAAVLLGLLRVADDDIVADYALTAEIMPRMLERWRAAADAEKARGGEAAELPPPHVFAAEPDTMRQVLAVLRQEYGSFEGYAAAHGIADDIVGALRATLVDR